MNKDDIVTIYGNPVKSTYKIGDAKLIHKICDVSDNFEQCQVSYITEPNIIRAALINKFSNDKKIS